MKGIFHSLYHPEIFQGNLTNEKYFEGWYYKIVSPGEKHAVAVIPGVALYNASDRHAFIQVINGVAQETSYHRFPLDAFSYSKDELNVSIGNNHFSASSVKLDLPELQGEIKWIKTAPLVSSIFSPGIMGWYSFVPGMQCYHGIVSVYHTLQGSTIGSLGPIDWNDGIGYLEKDWGSSFPKCWIWSHCNHFKDSGPASLMASVAHIPWMGKYFPGFIVILWIDGKEYRFATYNGSKMKCMVLEDRVFLEFKKGDSHLSVHAYKGKTAVLRSPILGQMTGKVNESLQARVDVKFVKAGKEIWVASGTTVGLEVAGDTTILESETWRS